MDEATAGSSVDSWFVYILQCGDGSFYTGITKDVNRRCEQHNAGTASRYTVGVEASYSGICDSHGWSSATSVEVAAPPQMVLTRLPTAAMYSFQFFPRMVL